MLIDHINQLECRLTGTDLDRTTYDFLVQFVHFLEAHTKTHFRFEEDCMKRHRCPIHQKNEQAHKEFMAFFQQFKEDTRHKGLRPEVFRALHKTISQWIEGHILKVDTQLKPCLEAADRARA